MIEKTIIYTKGGQNGDGENFSTKYCKLHQCKTENFERDVLWRCVFFPAVSPARLIWLVHKGFFGADIALIKDIRDATNFSQVWDAVNSHDVPMQKTNRLRRWLKIRISKAKLLELARLVFRQGK